MKTALVCLLAVSATQPHRLEFGDFMAQWRIPQQRSEFWGNSGQDFIDANPELVFFATCDNVLNVFVDGTPQQGSHDDNWRNSSRFFLPAGSGILAVSCLDYGGYRGLLGYINNGDPTNSLWKCTNQLESGWQNPDFDDRNWFQPTENGANGVSPWGHIGGINDAAHWIWTGSKISQYPQGPNQMWCRYKYEG